MARKPPRRSSLKTAKNQIRRRRWVAKASLSADVLRQLKGITSQVHRTRRDDTLAAVVIDELKWLGDFAGTLEEPDPLDSWVARLATKAPRAVQDLSDEKRRELAQRMASYEPYGFGDSFSRREKRLRDGWVNDGEQRIKNLRRKAQHAIDAIAKIQDALAETVVDSSMSDFKQLLRKTKKALDPGRLAEADALVRALREIPKEDSADDAKVALYNFFRNCGFHRDNRDDKAEAEIRTGVIGNVFLDWGVEVIDRHKDPQTGGFKVIAPSRHRRQPERPKEPRPGCDSVRMAVKGRLPRKGARIRRKSSGTHGAPDRESV